MNALGRDLRVLGFVALAAAAWLGLGPPRAWAQPTPELADAGIDLTMTGWVDKSAVQEVFRAHAAEVRSCFEQAALNATEEPLGKLTVAFVIGTRGEVRDFQVEPTGRRPAIAACLEKRISRWRFPVPDGGTVRVRYPFFMCGTW